MSKKQKRSLMTTQTLTFGGICIALSFLLSFVKIAQMPQGGSVTLFSMLPLMFFSFVCGPIAGIIAGIAYGFLQFFQDAYAAHILSIFLDYPLAFACLGFTGIVPALVKRSNTSSKLLNNIYFQLGLGMFIAILGRFIMHVLSGAIFFGMYAPEGMNPWVYSIVYNSTYLSVEFITSFVIGLSLVRTPIYKSLRVSFT